MTADPTQVRSFLERTLSLGSKMTGGVVGSLAGQATGMPALGAMLSPFVAHNLERVGKEVLDRHLAPRQEIRVGRAVTVARIRIAERVASGAKPRADGFLDEAEGGRSPADEITEQTLTAAMNAAEERKVDHIGALLASIALDDGIDSATAHQLIRIAEQIGFRSFVLLDMIHRDQARSYDPNSVRGAREAPAAVQALRAELFDLSRLGLVEKKNGHDMAGTLAIAGVADIHPTRLYLTPLGRLLRDSLDLEALSSDDPGRRDAKRLLAVLMHAGAPGSTIDGGTF